MRSRVLSDQMFDAVDELPELVAHTGRRIRDRHPAASTELRLAPVIEHVGDAHQVHIDPTGAIAVHMSITTERLPRDHAPQAGFLFGFADRRVARSLTFIDPALRDNPTLPAARSSPARPRDDPCGTR